jgi:hypothetical protein
MRAALVGGQHGTRGNRRERRAEARSDAARPSLTTGVALVAASAVAVCAVGSVDPARPVQAEGRAQLASHGADIRLAAASSILNIPQNLLADIINIPYSGLQGFDLLASAQLWGGQWIVTGPSNIWGTDPADAARFVAIAAMLFPFPALSGFNTEISPANPLGVLSGNGIGQQFWRFMAAEVPVNPYCDAQICVPTTPMSPITGIRGIDSLVWSTMVLTGTVDFPLTNSWFRVPPSKLANGTLDAETTYVENPSGEVYTLDGFGIPGTYKGPNGENLMPWAGTPINLNPAKPFQNWFDHLMADPAGNPIKLPSLQQFARALQTLAAGIVVGFDPFTPGSAFCPNYCQGLNPRLDYPAIVEWIGSLWPGNEKIDTWVAAYKAGRANTPTGVYITDNIELLKNAERFWDFSNPPLDPMFSRFGFNPSDLAPSFHKFWTSLGLNPDPLYPVAPSAAEVPVQRPLPAAASPVSSSSTSTTSVAAARQPVENAAEAAPVAGSDDVPSAPAALADDVPSAPAALADDVPSAPAALADDVPSAPIPGAGIGKAAAATGGHAVVGHRGRASESKSPAASASRGGGGGALNTADKDSAEGR